MEAEEAQEAEVDLGALLEDAAAAGEEEAGVVEAAPVAEDDAGTGASDEFDALVEGLLQESADTAPAEPEPVQETG